MKTIKDHLNKTSEMSKSITLHSAKLQKTADNIKYQVRKRVDEINQELKYREEIIIQDVEGNYEQATKSLKIEAEKVNLQQEILQNIQHSNVQLYLHGSQFELVTKGKSIEQTVQDNNPDDVELNLPELDTTEAELKLHDMKVCIIIVTSSHSKSSFFILRTSDLAKNMPYPRTFCFYISTPSTDLYL